MDKNEPYDIGDRFFDEIERLSQAPRKQVWENLERQLDKNEAGQYKRKFIAYRRMTVVLLFLLLSFATFTVIFIDRYQNDKTGHNKMISRKNSNANSKHPVNNNIRQHDGISSTDSLLLVGKSSDEKLIKDSFTKTGEIDNLTRENRKSIYRSAKGGVVAGKNTARSKNENNKSRNKYSISRSNIISKPPTEIPPENRKEITGNATAGAEELTVKKRRHLSHLLMPVPPLAAKKINKENTLIPVLLPVRHFPVSDPPAVSVNKKANLKSKKRNPVPERFSVTIYTAPEFAGYHLKDDELSWYDNKQVIEERERQDLSVSTGILIGYKLNERVSLQSGITYASSNISIDPSKIYAEMNAAGNIKYRYNTSSGYGYLLPSFSSSPAIGDSLYTRTSDHNLQYITIPVLATYRFGNRKFSFNPRAGVAFNFLTKAILNTEVVNSLNQENETITKLKGLKKVSSSLLLAPELQYRVSERWAFNAMLYFKNALAPVNKGNVVKTYPYHAGLGLGTVYRF